MTAPTGPTTSARTPAGNVTPATSVTPASSVTPATAVGGGTAGAPAIAPTTDTTTPAPAGSRTFPLMGVGTRPAPALPDDHPQVVAARASNDGTATLDTSRAPQPVATAPAAGSIPSPTSASGSASS